jgi:hypothetical protein
VHHSYGIERRRPLAGCRRARVSAVTDYGVKNNFKYAYKLVDSEGGGGWSKPACPTVLGALIRLDLPHGGQVSGNIYDVSGPLVRALSHEEYMA